MLVPGVNGVETKKGLEKRTPNSPLRRSPMDKPYASLPIAIGMGLVSFSGYLYI